MGILKTTKNHSHEVKELGILELVGLYKGARIPALYRCKKHKEIHYSLPTNVLKGRGLLCCKKAGMQAQADRKKELAAKKYDSELSVFGKLRRLESYIDSKTPIEHQCLLHGEIGKISPSGGRVGKGLKCCWKAAYEKEAARKAQKAREEFRLKLSIKNPNIEWVGGDYINNHSKLLFRCRKHKEEYPVTPNQVLNGHGLFCCGQETRRITGKRMGSLNGVEFDNVWRALTGQLQRRGETKIYLFTTSVKGFNKFGISFDPDKRAENGGYCQKVIDYRHFPEREDAVLIEQAYSFLYACKNVPISLKTFIGNTELTKATPKVFLKRILKLEFGLQTLGRWEFAEKYCDPDEVKRARHFLNTLSSAIC